MFFRVRNAVFSVFNSEEAVVERAVANIGRPHIEHDPVAQGEVQVKARAGDRYHFTLNGFISKIGMRKSGCPFPGPPGPVAEGKPLFGMTRGKIRFCDY